MVRPIIYVDGYCIGNPGPCGCRGVMDGKQIFIYDLGLGTNNIAEFYAVAAAIKYIKDHELTPAILYSDSMTALSWIKNRHTNSSVPNENLKKAVDYIKSIKKIGLEGIDILHWKTKLWGEIPADFGYKNQYRKNISL